MAFFAVWALFCGGFVPGYEIAVGVAVATKENFAAFGAFLGDFAAAVFSWTGDVERDGFGVFATRIARTGKEFAEFSAFNVHVFAAIGALTADFDDFFNGNDLAVFFAAKFHGVFAGRVV